MGKARTLVTLSVALAILVVLLPAVSQVQGSNPQTVTIKFAVSGLPTYNSDIITINGTVYDVSKLAQEKFVTEPGSVYIVAAKPSVTGWDAHVYGFANWVNGGTLTGSSGIYTVPNKDTTVTANYTKISFNVRFDFSGFSNVDGPIIVIDGVSYARDDVDGKFNKDYYLPKWVAGSIHTIQVNASVSSWETPPKVYLFSNWTNGNGLTGASGNFVMPNHDVTVTANYAPAVVRKITFAASNIPNFNGVTLIIDGTAYQYSNLPSFSWMPGTTHTVTASTPITADDKNIYQFQNWNNGNGLSGATGIFTTPNANTTVTANYLLTTYRVHFDASGLSNFDGPIFVIDGTTYTYGISIALTVMLKNLSGLLVLHIRCRQ